MPRLPALALAALALVLPSLGAPALALAQATDTRPMVLVVDPGRARVSSDRLLRVIGAATGRDVVRITDARAADPAGTLTIAYEGSGAWMVRFDSRGRSAVAHERIRPGALDAAISAAALRVIGDVETAAASSPSTPSAALAAQGAAGRATARSLDPARDERSAYVTLVDEILDPFASMPVPPPREVAIYSEVLDPFAPSTAPRVGWSEVIDPWDR